MTLSYITFCIRPSKIFPSKKMKTATRSNRDDDSNWRFLWRKHAFRIREIPEPQTNSILPNQLAGFRRNDRRNLNILVLLFMAVICVISFTLIFYFHSTARYNEFEAEKISPVEHGELNRFFTGKFIARLTKISFSK